MDSKLSEKVVNKELDILEEDDLEDEVVLEKPKTKRQGKNTGENWVLTPKRAEALKKAQIKLKEKNDIKKQEKMIKEEEERKIIEQKVIAKAIALKKRQLKKEEAIDNIPVEVPLRARPKPLEKEVYTPKYRFL